MFVACVCVCVLHATAVSLLVAVCARQTVFVYSEEIRQDSPFLIRFFFHYFSFFNFFPVLIISFFFAFCFIFYVILYASQSRICAIKCQKFTLFFHCASKRSQTPREVETMPRTHSSHARASSAAEISVHTSFTLFTTKTCQKVFKYFC